MDKDKLLTELYDLYKSGLLASKFDPITNKMENIPELDNLMTQAKSHLPKALEPIDAATKMRHLNESKRDQAIEESTQTVIDLRKEFLAKMAKNGGTQGLVLKAAEAYSNNNLEELIEILELMKQYSEQ